jgi:hypothetical protein
MAVFEMDERISQAGRSEIVKAERTRQLNDAFRRDPRGGGTVLTIGVQRLPPAKLGQLLAIIRAFDAFTPADDPYEEHDFAAVEFEGERYLGKSTTTIWICSFDRLTPATRRLRSGS